MNFMCNLGYCGGMFGIQRLQTIPVLSPEFPLSPPPRVLSREIHSSIAHNISTACFWESFRGSNWALMLVSCWRNTAGCFQLPWYALQCESLHISDSAHKQDRRGSPCTCTWEQLYPKFWGRSGQDPEKPFYISSIPSPSNQNVTISSHLQTGLTGVNKATRMLTAITNLNADPCSRTPESCDNSFISCTFSIRPLLCPEMAPSAPTHTAMLGQQLSALTSLSSASKHRVVVKSH